MNPVWRASFWLILGVALILFLSLGIRHAFGLFLTPMSFEFGWGREVYAFAIALQNLVWGLTQPFAGALADRFGARRTIFAGGALYTAGLVLMGFADSPWMLSLSTGLLVGIGLSGVSFPVLLGVVGRAVPPEKRSMAMGIASAAGSLGQFAMLPGTLGLIGWLGWAGALLALGVLGALMMPLAGMVNDVPVKAGGTQQTLGEALREAFAHPGFWLLALGFFVCGFQVVFIGVHIPAYLIDQSLGDDGAGLGRAVQYLRDLVRGLAGRELFQAQTVECVISGTGRGDYPVCHLAAEHVDGLCLWDGNGRVVAVHRAFDQWHGGDIVWRAQPVHARRDCLSAAPGGCISGRLARRGVV